MISQSLGSNEYMYTYMYLLWWISLPQLLIFVHFSVLSPALDDLGKTNVLIPVTLHCISLSTLRISDYASDLM